MSSMSEGAPAGMPPALVAAKAGIEQMLRRDPAQGAPVRSLDVATSASNLQGVAIGIADPAAAHPQAEPSGDPGQPQLTVFLAEPAPAPQVRSIIVEAMGVEAAAAQEEVPLRPVVTGLIDAQPHRLRLRPAPAGDSIAHVRVSAGTLGALAVGRRPPRSQRLLVLSNNHVLANCNDATIGDAICQPGAFDGGTVWRDQVAVLESFAPLSFGGAPNAVDCATAWAWPDRVRPDMMRIAGGQPSYFRAAANPVAPELGMQVGKSGRTTQVTSGRITGLDASVWVNYTGGRSAYFEGQIAIQGFGGDFSAGGDSGSLVWTLDPLRRPVALLFAGGGGVTFANPIGLVLEALDITLYT
jgi:hypothetical protein